MVGIEGTIFPLLSCPSTQSEGTSAYHICHYQLGQHCPPHPGDFLAPALPNPHTSPDIFQQLFLTSYSSQLMLQTFLKPLKGPQTPNKQWLALACPLPLAKQPLALVAVTLDSA